MKSFIYASCLAICISGCKAKQYSTTTGNPLVNILMTGSAQARTVAKSMLDILLNLTFPKAVALPPPNSIIDLANNSVLLSQAWVNIGKLELKVSELPEVGEVNGDSIEFVGPFMVDLLTPSPQVLSNGIIGVPEFRRLKYTFEKVQTLPQGAPAQIQNNSVYLEGSVGAVAFSFVTVSEVQTDTAGPNLVSPRTGDNMLLQIQFANFFRKIDLTVISSGGVTVAISDTNRVSATNPCPAIDSSAADLYTCFLKGLSAESNFGVDKNGNYELENTDSTVK